MTVHTSDVVVLGGGSGGYATALRARELDLSVTLIERDRVGGTCLHRGCVPTKALLHTAEVADTVRHAAAAGVAASLEGVDGPAALAWRQKIVDGKFRGLTSLLAARGVQVVTGSGSLTRHDGVPAVRVGDDLYAGRHVVLATGASTRALPGVEFSARVLDAERALSRAEIPERAVVIGGGVIGVEFASAWRSLGTEVTIVEAQDTLIAGEEAASQSALAKAFTRRGIDLRLGARVAGVVDGDGGVVVSVEREGVGEDLSADVVLVAVGRAPSTAGLGFEEAGISLTRGFVDVDPELRTGAEGVWAVGDIVAGPQLAHRGFRHGIAVAERIAGRRTAPLDDALVPRVTYSSPEVASVGLTERAAIEIHGADAIASTEVSLAGNAKSEIVAAGSPARPGFAKVVRLAGGPVLGVHLVGERVGELITEGQLAVAWEAHPEDIAPLVHAHPTQSEALGEAFLALAGSPLHTM
ncbi:FAD-dependent oxidoreductase [Microbacterium excoecariae]|uniref:FAD-dependent oxidoreductase n=1 Tax=Microbacterium excoecariae TaxID=2715210 RepID=UPI00140CD8CF|nr:FAD-dependent oxidoreductase [Microbacterium excoecariae]